MEKLLETYDERPDMPGFFEYIKITNRHER
jgi:hypothetical protein